jgi:hypothetical protein
MFLVNRYAQSVDDLASVGAQVRFAIANRRLVESVRDHYQWEVSYAQVTIRSTRSGAGCGVLA